jgi:O-antigen ligase
VPALLLGALALGGFFVAAPLYARERIATTAGGQLTGDLGTRLELYRLAADSVLGHPLGLGWGGYARVAVPGYAYPHDLPLEVLAEAGLVCGGIFLVWLVWTYATIWRVRAGFVGSAVAGLLTFGLLNALVSGDLNDNRTVFFTLGLGLAVAATAARERDGTGAADVHPPPALLTTAVPS